MTIVATPATAHLNLPQPVSDGVPLFLASVRNAEEARIAHDYGADIIDAKEPSAGSLGAVSAETLRAMRRAVGAQAVLSATIGDAPRTYENIAAATDAAVEAGADIVKIGLFPGTDWRAARPLADKIPLAAVLLADQDPPLAKLNCIKDAGFSVVLLDTANKSAGALTDVLPMAEIEAFVRSAQDLGLAAGLAGALRTNHIPALKALNPNLMGFRGALTQLKERSQAIDAQAVADIRSALMRHGASNADERSST